MGTRFDQFMEYQIEKQIYDPAQVPFKKELNFQPFKNDMDAMTNERYRLVEKQVIEKTVREVQKSIEEGKMTYVELTVFYLKRIRSVDVGLLNSIIELNPMAIKQAEKCDQRRSLMNHNIFGMPIIVKDNILAGEYMHTTAGCPTLNKICTAIKAPIVERIESYGGIILAKANLSQWAFYMSSKGVCGFTALGGQCHNPYGEYGVGGSSSGSAVAVSANLCMLSIGTETQGSIINPSGQNGVVGIYPSRGLCPNGGIIPISHSLDTPGPMARTVEDAALLLDAISIERNAHDSKISYRIGLIVNEEIKDSRRTGDEQELKKLIGELEEIGFHVDDIQFDQEVMDINMKPIMEYEFNYSMRKYFKEAEIPYTDLADIIQIYEKTPEMALYGYDLLSASVNTAITKEENKERFKSNQLIAQKGIDQALEQYDALISMSSQLSKVYASAGYPSLIVPGGYRESGEPVGVTFTAGKGDENLLIEIASRYEKATHHRKNPVRG